MRRSCQISVQDLSGSGPNEADSLRIAIARLELGLPSATALSPASIYLSSEAIKGQVDRRAFGRRPSGLLEL